MSSVRDYLGQHVGDDYEARGWDCSKLVVGWLARTAPKTARAVVELAISHGYNKVARGDDEGLAKVQRRFGATPSAFAMTFHRKLPELVDLPVRAQPGDVVVRGKGPAMGLVGDDFHVYFLARPRGYKRRPVEPGDVLLRGLA